MKRILNSLLFLFGFHMVPQVAWAVDSYRYMHVTIETPWMIFLFLLPIVLAPLILMAILYWHFSLRRPKEKQDGEAENAHESSDLK